jgi:GR25 family glycosyltransferase involved in LPS biosynthesis/glycosyltransferase involved in cell wall biosynthesis
MIKYEKYGITLPNFSDPIFSIEECRNSNKILFYSGYSPFRWNYTYSINNALGGSETAITCLSKSFPEKYEIYVAGDVTEEKVDNITYVHFDNLQNLIKNNAFHTVIVSRYLNFYELYRNFSAYQTFIWGHDITLYAYGTDLSVESILTKWSSKITGCVCQTEWHKNLFLSSFPQLKDKFNIINNGINTHLFNMENKKQTNKFVYTSCSERGLSKLIQLWPNILENLPDAELFISSYNDFPKSDEDNKINEFIKNNSSIKHLGKLNRKELYEMMSSAEYWLYPSYFQETSCITSLELLASEVICLYYPIAGLVNTVGDYGIQISEGNEVDKLLNLSIKQKIELKKKGKQYALSSSWKNRAEQWCNMFFSNDLHIAEVPVVEKNNIKIINLKRREDRKKSMIKQFEIENIKSTQYEFIEAVDGNELIPTPELFLLFERNDFNYKKGVIGCALSHMHLWNQLINDEKNDFYVILEDDINFCDNFKQHLGYVCKIFVEQNLEHLALGEYLSNKKFPNKDTKIETYKKDLYKEWNCFFAYILSKSAAVKSINYINNCSIKCAIDNPQAFGYILQYSSLNTKLVHCEIVNEHGSDIQTNKNDKFFFFSLLFVINFFI